MCDTQADKLALKPANLTFEQAAAVLTAALTALQGLRKAGKVQPARRVLISGAAGGVGAFAVPIGSAPGKERIEAGKVTPVIDPTYPLRTTSAVVGYLAEAHRRKTVITVMQNGLPATRSPPTPGTRLVGSWNLC